MAYCDAPRLACRAAVRLMRLHFRAASIRLTIPNPIQQASRTIGEPKLPLSSLSTRAFRFDTVPAWLPAGLQASPCSTLRPSSDSRTHTAQARFRRKPVHDIGTASSAYEPRFHKAATPLRNAAAQMQYTFPFANANSFNQIRQQQHQCRERITRRTILLPPVTCGSIPPSRWA